MGGFPFGMPPGGKGAVKGKSGKPNASVKAAGPKAKAASAKSPQPQGKGKTQKPLSAKSPNDANKQVGSSSAGKMQNGLSGNQGKPNGRPF
jgi:hypothetical protein